MGLSQSKEFWLSQLLSLTQGSEFLDKTPKAWKSKLIICYRKRRHVRTLEAMTIDILRCPALADRVCGRI